MRIERWWSARGGARGQSGFSTRGLLLGVAATATMAGVLVANGGDQVAAVERSACAYDKTIVVTAIDADQLLDDDLAYATPAGEDGMDEIRAAGLLRTHSRYWRYEGLDEVGQPRLVMRADVPGCA